MSSVKETPSTPASLSRTVMACTTLYIDEGNLLDFHDDRDAAEASVLSVVEEHP